ncbi:MAG: TldD/PmbA family protein, partial [Sphaerochaetaceae bacterium]|nr:TldD/PmbA family protein [Sphaerochaetaceae bacterium]
MISKALIQEAILAAMSTGADFAEVFYEHTENHSINMLDDHVRNIDDGTICGVGIRAYSGFRATYGSTSDLSYDSVIRCAKSVAWALMEGKASINPKNLEERIFPNIHPIKVVPSTAGLKKKIDILKSGYDSAKNRDSKIIQVTGTLLDVDRNIVVANSEGLYTSDRQIRTRMMIRSVASANGENQTGGCAPGRSMGLELFEDVVDPVEVGRHASDVALENLKGTYCKAGTYTVAIENGFGGVIFHESCGHSLEASSVAFGASEFCGKIGQVIANPKVTAIDDGTIPNAWGSVNIDDEGIPTQKKILIEKGVLKRYMVDRLNGRRMNMASSGSSRRQNYSFEPTSRMTNTYIAAGEDE